MANDNTYQDPNNVPGSEGELPATDEGFRQDPPREDPAGVGVDSDGTDMVDGQDPLDIEARTPQIGTPDEAAHVVDRIENADETKDPL
ncbi:MAG TPA: hypothetical protein VD735_06015 [Candidatus Saccharimonadales bacterium]|nr:hypothetical protein [Candidatus Saccharimonadales bacterium]